MLCVEMGRQYWAELGLKEWLLRGKTGSKPWVRLASCQALDPTPPDRPLASIIRLRSDMERGLSSLRYRRGSQALSYQQHQERGDLFHSPTHCPVPSSRVHRHSHGPGPRPGDGGLEGELVDDGVVSQVKWCWLCCSRDRRSMH